jgi:group I intron endonuclease
MNLKQKYRRVIKGRIILCLEKIIVKKLKQKISDSQKEIDHSGRFQPGENNPMFGKNHTDETLIKLLDAKKGKNNPMFGKPRVEGAGKPSQSIKVFDLKNNTTTIYNSIHEASRTLNLPSHKAISNYIKNNQKKPYKKRYTFALI